MDTPTPRTQSSPAIPDAAITPTDILRHERGQAAVRIAVCIAVAVYLVGASYPHTFASGVPFWFVFISAYTLFSAGLTLAIWWSTESFAWRRYMANVGDITAISYLMVAVGENGIPLFALYL